jgi:hemoglobin
MEKRSLFERLGGEEAIIAAVDLFYEKLLADARVSHFFEALDVDAQAKKQVTFMAWAFGAPETYKGRDLRAAHAGLLRRGLSDEHFDAVAQHLRATLEELGIEEPLIGEALGIVAGTRADVLGR